MPTWWKYAYFSKVCLFKWDHANILVTWLYFTWCKCAYRRLIECKIKIPILSTSASSIKLQWLISYRLSLAKTWLLFLPKPRFLWSFLESRITLNAQDLSQHSISTCHLIQYDAVLKCFIISCYLFSELETEMKNVNFTRDFQWKKLRWRVDSNPSPSDLSFQAAK